MTVKDTGFLHCFMASMRVKNRVPNQFVRRWSSRFANWPEPDRFHGSNSNGLLEKGKTSILSVGLYVVSRR